MTIISKFGCNWLSSFIQDDFQLNTPKATILNYVRVWLSSWLVCCDAGHNLVEDHVRTIPSYFGCNRLNSFRRKKRFNIPRPTSIFITLTILECGLECRTQWKRTTHGPFHQRLFLVGWAVSDEKFRFLRDVMRKTHKDFKARWAKKETRSFLSISFANKCEDVIKPGHILHHVSVTAKILLYFKDHCVLIIYFTYTLILSLFVPKIFN